MVETTPASTPTTSTTRGSPAGTHLLVKSTVCGGVGIYQGVGNVVWDPLSELHADKVFEPGTAVNCETQIFLPRHVGQFFSIDTLLFDDDEAVIASDLPATLTVIG